MKDRQDWAKLERERESSLCHVKFCLHSAVSVFLSPIPRYNWTRVGGPLPPKHYKLSYDKVLVIPNVQPSDEGIYICEAINTKGKKEERVLLTIACKYRRHIGIPQVIVTVG